MTVNRNHRWILSIRPVGQLTGDEFSWNEAPVKDAWSPQNAAHFGSPTPRSAAPSASLTGTPPTAP